MTVMQAFRTFDAIAAPIPLANVNTDQIFPARFIKKPRTAGYAQFSFHDIRRDPRGELRTDFPLNRPEFVEAGILVTGPNFGCGSSREGAVYTLLDAGIRAIVASSFGDIFAANCLKNGLLTVLLPETEVQGLMTMLETAASRRIVLDLEAELLRRPDGSALRFAPDAFQKYCLLNGLNEIDLSLAFSDRVDAFEAAYRSSHPWLAP